MGAPHSPATQTPYGEGQITSNLAQSYENSLPSYLNINQNPIFNPTSPDATGFENNYANQFYNQYEAPQVGKIEANNVQTGMQNSSSGGAEVGQAAAEGQAISGLAGTQAYEALLQGLNQTSAGYFQGPGALGAGTTGQSNQLNENLFNTQSSNYQSQLGALNGLLGTSGPFSEGKA